MPWGSLLGWEADYVDPEYLPANFTFKEPSKLSKQEALDRLKACEAELRRREAARSVIRHAAE